MHPALTNTLSLISNTYRSAKQKPLTTGAAALTAAAVTGVSLGAAFGPTASVGAASHLNLATHPAAVIRRPRRGPLYAAAAGLAPSGHPSPADLPRHPAVSARLDTRPEHQAAPAPKHPAPARHQPATRHVAAKAVTKTAVAKHPAARHAPAKPAQPAAPGRAEAPGPGPAPGGRAPGRGRAGQAGPAGQAVPDL